MLSGSLSVSMTGAILLGIVLIMAAVTLAQDLAPTIRVRNKASGLVWEVGGKHARRLLKDPDYEEVKTVDVSQIKVAAPSLESLTVKDLREIAGKYEIHGIDKMNKAELIRAIETAGNLYHAARESGVPPSPAPESDDRPPGGAED